MEDIFTARKRSLGQGNIFIGVCQEFCSRGGGVSGAGGVSDGPLGGSSRGGVCSGGCLVPEGICSRGGGGWVPGGDPPGRPLLQAVRILLEYILVMLLVLHGLLQTHPQEK